MRTNRIFPVLLLSAVPALAQERAGRAPRAPGGKSTSSQPFALAPPPPFYDEVDLFVAGDFGVNTYRIPALVTSIQGTLIAVCDARQDNSSDLPGNIDIVLRRSTDKGQTWSPITTIADFPTGHGAGDPSLLVDRWTGRIFCFYAYGPPGIGFFASQPGTNNTTDPNTLHAHVITSDDDGLTWSAATDLNPEIKDPSWAGLFASSGHGIQMRNGRLLQPYAVRDGAGVISARNAFSDDCGATWQMGAAAGLGVNESKLVERNDGSLLQNMRHNSVNARFTAISTDGGMSFGPVSQSSLIDPRVNASLTLHSATAAGDGSDVLLFSNPRNTAARINLTVQLSYDEGVTWPDARVIHNGPAAYSSLTVMDDKTVGLFYERGNFGSTERITFARFNLAWVRDSVRTVLDPQTLNPLHPSLWTWIAADDMDSVNGPGPDFDGDLVDSWEDVSGGSFHDLPRSTDGPGVFRAAALNGRPTVELSGNSDLWGAAGSGGEVQTIPNAFTLFAVVRVRDVVGTHYVFDKATNAGGVGLRATFGSPPRWELHVGRNATPTINTVIPSAAIALDTFAVHTVLVDGNSIEHYVNSAVSAASTFQDGGTAVQQGGLILGADVGTENDATCEFAEVIVYGSTLTTAQRVSVENYLRSKYAL